MRYHLMQQHMKRNCPLSCLSNFRCILLLSFIYSIACNTQAQLYAFDQVCGLRNNVVHRFIDLYLLIDMYLCTINHCFLHEKHIQSYVCLEFQGFLSDIYTMYYITLIRVVYLELPTYCLCHSFSHFPLTTLCERSHMVTKIPVFIPG